MFLSRKIKPFTKDEVIIKKIKTFIKENKLSRYKIVVHNDILTLSELDQILKTNTLDNTLLLKLDNISINESKRLNKFYLRYIKKNHDVQILIVDHEIKHINLFNCKE